MSHERPPNRKHLLLAARERSSLLGNALFQARKQLENAIQVRLIYLALGERTHFQVFQDGHPRKNAAAFGRLNDAQLHDLVGRHAADPTAVQGDLTSAVRSDQGYDFALLDLDRYALQRVNVSVMGVDISEVEHRRHAGAPPTASAPLPSERSLIPAAAAAEPALPRYASMTRGSR